MRRVVAKGLLLAAVPVGVGVGLWMALQTDVPGCPVRGLGTLSLCAARPRFDPRLCVLGGGDAAAFGLLVSIAVRGSVSRVAIFDIAAAGAGIVTGLWTSLMVYPYPPCGPHQLCLASIAQRFATWQSALMGAAVFMAILAVGAAVNTDFRRVTVGATRTVKHWLFQDLSRITPAAGPGSDAG